MIQNEKILDIERDWPRPLKFTPNINPYAAGSLLVEFGETKVHITASVEASVPPFLKNTKRGWLTAEYNMLPGATHTRSKRERSKIGGRTSEIQRLIGRSLRSAVDLEALGERSILIDCDVLVADGGTRTASISGSYVALVLAVENLIESGTIMENPVHTQIAGISVGISSTGKVLADLNYEEDSSCRTDMNIVMTSEYKFVEIQGTAEKEAFSAEELSALLACAQKSLIPVFEAQREAIKIARNARI